MTLTRTKSGLQNLHILKGVDLIVYTEGGDQETLTKEQVLEGAGHKKSVDIRFWSKMFAQFLPGQSVKILAVGSCSTLSEIAKEISAGNLKNVCVAMDRDYSNFWNTLIDHNRVVYTRTYSWENELFQTDVIFRTFEQIALDAFDGPEVRQIIEDARKALLCHLRHFFKADLVLVAANSSLFCRDNPAACFRHAKRATLPPEIDSIRMRDRLRTKKDSIRGVRLVSRPAAASLDVARDVFGKPLLVAAIRLLQHLILRADQKSLPNDYLERFLLNAFFDWIRENPASDIATAYNEKFARITAAA